MKLIVGLGNPGREYENTRHNIGFMVIDKYVLGNNLGSFSKKYNGLFLKQRHINNEVIFLKPQSYINLSGEVISSFIKYFKIDIDDILIIHDDLDMACGKIRLKQKGSSGGHNGLKNIELFLHTQEYKRLKIGISNDKNILTKDYVLGNFSKEESIIIQDALQKSCEIIDDFLSLDFKDLMNKYN